MTEMLEFRWIDPSERLPGVGVEVLVKTRCPIYPDRRDRQRVRRAQIELISQEKKFTAPLMRWVKHRDYGSTTDALDVIGWWPIPPTPEEDTR